MRHPSGHLCTLHSNALYEALIFILHSTGAQFWSSHYMMPMKKTFILKKN